MLAHLPVALVVLVLGVSITMVLSRSRKPAYTSETVIYYRFGINRVYVGVEGEGDDIKALPARLKETLLSRAYLEKIIKEFNLYPQIVAAEGYIAAVDRFRTKITFKPRSAETFQIAFEGATAEEAQEVTARLADVLIEDMAERKKAQAKTTTDYLEAEKKRADDDLAKREADLARFMALHPEFAGENNAEQAGSAVRAEKVKAATDPEIGAIERQQQRLRAAVAAKAGGGAPAAGGAAGPAGPAPDNTLQNQKAAADQELAAAQKDLSEKSEKLTDNHPDVKAAKNRVAAALAKQRDATVALMVAAPAPAAAPKPAAKAAGDDLYDSNPTGDELKRLESELQKNERDLQLRRRGVRPDAKENDLANRIIDIETEWKTLNREREKARTRQGDIDVRLFKARGNEASELGGYNSQVQVLDPAFLPNQSSTMPKGKFIVLGVVVSLVLGLVLAAVYGMLLDDRVFVAEDLSAFAPVLVAVPKGPAEKGKRRG
ncbi:MAG: protein kinase [Polyangiaceae bacterium]